MGCVSAWGENDFSLTAHMITPLFRCVCHINELLPEINGRTSVDQFETLPRIFVAEQKRLAQDYMSDAPNA